MDDDELLDTRMCDLGLTLRGTAIQSRIDEVHGELKARDLKFKPHCWLSSEWFSPDGVPGVAIPFYLAHRRLIRLERKQLLEVEGGSRESFLKILRHETGHAIDTAFRLRRRARYRKTFGNPSQPYPEHYLPRPSSRRFVQHLDMWYAQSHPLEDFAETFAVWLRPGDRWKRRYKNWPAIGKLRLVDSMMDEIAGQTPPVRSRAQTEPLSQLTMTLRQHYRAKRQHYGLDYPSVFDNDLRKLFTGERSDTSQPTAAQFLARIRRELRDRVAKWTGEYSYTIDQVIAEMIARCRDLKLRLGSSPEEAKQDAMVLVAMRTTTFIHEGRHRIAM